MSDSERAQFLHQPLLIHTAVHPQQTVGHLEMAFPQRNVERSEGAGGYGVNVAAIDFIECIQKRNVIRHCCNMRDCIPRVADGRDIDMDAVTAR